MASVVRFLVPAVVSLLLPAAAAAQSTAGAANLQIPPDVRAEGMGRAWAPFATTPYAAWGNVGGLGFLEGFQVAKMNARLVPDLADDVHFEYFSMAVGYSPLSSPIPLNIVLGYNRTDLGYGESFITGPGSPEPIGTFESYEDTEGFTAALGVAGLLGVGVGVKKTDVMLAPEEVAGPGAGSGDATATDYGVLARSPYLILDAGEGKLRFDGEAKGQVSLRALGALAWSNRGDPISLGGGGSADPLPKVRRESIGVELHALPVSRLVDLKEPILRRLFRDTHLVTVSAAVGREKDLLRGDVPDSVAKYLSKNEREGIVTHDGFEIRVLDMFSYRRGTIFDDPGEIKGTTEGWGLSLFGYFGIDYAEIPQFRELKRVEKFSIWVRVPLDWL